MAGAIFWDGNTLIFPAVPEIWTMNKYAKNVGGKSQAGVKVTHHRYYLWRMAIGIKGVLTPQMEADLHTWWDWAVRGEVYSVAFDSTKILDTTISSDSVSGQAVLNVTATAGAGIVAGDFLTITKADREREEVVIVSSITATTITVTQNLKRDWEDGDTIRHYRFFPACTSVSADLPLKIVDSGVNNYLEFSHTVEEAVDYDV